MGVVIKQIKCDKVLFALEQSLLALATHPDINFEAINYLQQMSTLMAEKCEVTTSKYYAEEAVQMFERAIKSTMKNNMLIYFAYADYEEVLLVVLITNAHFIVDVKCNDKMSQMLLTNIYLLIKRIFQKIHLKNNIKIFFLFHFVGLVL